MRIAVDCDGVLYEWSKTARYMLRQYKGYPREGPMGEESTYWEYIKDNVTHEDWRWLWTEAIELGLYRYGHVVTGAVMGLRTLQAMKHELILATHRPASAVMDTLAFIHYISDSKREPIIWQGFHLLTNNEPKTVVDADMLIDDKPENVVTWAEAGRRALLFSREWNQEVIPSPGGVWRINGWKGVVEWFGVMSGTTANRTS